MSGSYYIVENIEFLGCGNIVILGADPPRGARHSEVPGNRLAAGSASELGRDDVDDIVIWDN